VTPAQSPIVFEYRRALAEWLATGWGDPADVRTARDLGGVNANRAAALATLERWDEALAEAMTVHQWAASKGKQTWARFVELIAKKG
jgi:hypothetical protein